MMKQTKNKKGLQISFAWIFAIVVGIFIIFLAIYGVTKISDSEKEIAGAKTSKEIGVLLNPLETGFESGKKTEITMPVETRIHNRCGLEGIFGRQIIKVSQKNFGKWSETNTEVGFSNKYIFSEGNPEGKSFFVFSKPFEFPFKISDVIYLTSSNDNYCFINAPTEIEKEITDLNQENLYTENCPLKSKNICFDDSAEDNECYAEVDYFGGAIRKNSEVVYFVTDALMYAGIFSEPEIYECQVKRLMNREKELLSIYADKEDALVEKGCTIDVNFNSLKLKVGSFENSEDLTSVFILSEEVGRANERARCRLW